MTNFTRGIRPEKTVMNQLVPFNEDIAFYAFRYALGRRTYAVTDVVNHLRAHWGMFTRETRNTIVEETREAITDDKAGDDCDRNQWMGLLTHAQEVKGSFPYHD